MLPDVALPDMAGDREPFWVWCSEPSKLGQAADGEQHSAKRDPKDQVERGVGWEVERGVGWNADGVG